MIRVDVYFDKFTVSVDRSNYLTYNLVTSEVVGDRPFAEGAFVLNGMGERTFQEL